MGLDSDDIVRGLVVIVVIKGLDSRCVKVFYIMKIGKSEYYF